MSKTPAGYMDYDRLWGVEIQALVKVLLLTLDTLYVEHHHNQYTGLWGGVDTGVPVERCPICKAHQTLHDGLGSLVDEKDARERRG